MKRSLALALLALVSLTVACSSPTEPDYTITGIEAQECAFWRNGQVVFGACP